MRSSLTCKLEVAPGQRGFVAGNPWSLAPVAHEPAGRAAVPYDGDTPVGLVLLFDERHGKDEPANQLYAWRLMVDARHQRRRIGRLAMAWVIEQAGTGNYASVGLTHWPDEGHAGRFDERLGFRYTGEVDTGERALVLRLGSPAA